MGEAYPHDMERRVTGGMRPLNILRVGVQHSLHVVRQLLMKRLSAASEPFIMGDFVFCPYYIKSSNEAKGNVPVRLRLSPVATIANVRRFFFQPVRAMLTGPRLGPVARPAQQHVLVNLPFGPCGLSRYLIRNAMINLEIPCLIYLRAHVTSPIGNAQQALLEVSREGRPTPYPISMNSRWVAETISGYTSPLGVSHLKSLKRNPLFPDIAGGSWRMVIPVKCP